jgi:hypothetical protein
MSQQGPKFETRRDIRLMKDDLDSQSAIGDRQSAIP